MSLRRILNWQEEYKEWMMMKKNYKPKDIFLETFLRFQQKDRIIINLLEKALSDGDEDERWIAVKVLGDMGGETAIEILEKVSRQDPSESIRAEASNELASYAHVPSGLEQNRDTLKDASTRVRRETDIISYSLPIDEVSPEKVTLQGKVKKHLFNLGEFITVLLQKPNLAVATLYKEGEQPHIHSAKVNRPILLEFGFESELLVRSKYENNTLQLIFDLEPQVNPAPITLIIEVGDVEKRQSINGEDP